MFDAPKFEKQPEPANTTNEYYGIKGKDGKAFGNMVGDNDNSIKTKMDAKDDLDTLANRNGVRNDFASQLQNPQLANSQRAEMLNRQRDQAEAHGVLERHFA